MDSFDKKKSKAVADQDIQIKGGEGAGHPDTEIIGGGGSVSKKLFRPSGLSLV